MKDFSRVFIKNESNELLIIKDLKGIWHFPGGKKEIGETDKECAIREAKEEVNLDVIELEEVYNSDFIFNDVEWKGHFYFVNKVKGDLFLNEPDKIEKMEFVKSINIDLFLPAVHKLIEDVIFSDKFISKKTKWL